MLCYMMGFCVKSSKFTELEIVNIYVLKNQVKTVMKQRNLMIFDQVLTVMREIGLLVVRMCSGNFVYQNQLFLA